MKTKVYFTKEITSESLVKIYESLKHELKGRIAVKISTGEPGGHNFFNPNLIKALVNKLNGTIVECCTAYAGKRMHPSDHWQVIKDHGFYDIAPCDIMDEDGEITIPINGGKHLKGINYVGSHIKNYDIRLSCVVSVMVGFIVMLSDMVSRMIFWGGFDNDRDKDNNANGFLMLIGFICLILSPIFGSLMQLALSRKREFF